MVKKKSNNHLFEIVYNFDVNNAKINESSDAFLELRSKWAQNEISTKKEYKILGLDKTNHAVCEISLTPKQTERRLKDIDFLEFFKAASEANVSRIYICENSPYSSINPTRQKIDLVQQLQNMAKRKHIELLDQIIMSYHSFYSFAQNNYI